MQSLGQTPWWVTSVLVPALLIVLGAGIAFLAGRLKDWLDARKAKQAFLKAIALELTDLQEQLGGSLEQLESALSSFRTNTAGPPHGALALPTTAFQAQLGKLRDVSDPLVMEVIQFYSGVPILERIVDMLNRREAEYLNAFLARRQVLKEEILSLGEHLSEQLSEFRSRALDLLGKFPAQKR